MKQFSRERVFVMSVLLVVFLAGLAWLGSGCALNQNLTPSAQYYGTLKTFDDNVETYLAAYRVATPETQAKWKATIDPLILAANQALQTWRLAQNSPTAGQKEQAWKDAQKKFIAALTTAGILKVEGGK